MKDEFEASRSMVMWLLLISVIGVAMSGVPGLLLSRRSVLGQRIATALSVLGSIGGAAAIALHFARPDLPQHIAFGWGLPPGRFAVALDDLSVLFLIPVLLISALGSIYGMSYWRQREYPASGRKLRLCWGLLAAAMAMVVLARDGVLFLMSWEVMALAAFFLVSTEEEKPETREAGWIYLVATHAGTLCLIAFFALLRLATGGFGLWPSAVEAISPQMATALFALGAIGFGLKAGVMPLHVWLPGAHANAPSHVSAILSGVLLKMGIYGLVRVAGLVPHPPLWWGATLLAAGTISAVLAIAFAAGQHDLKRLLAYSSIENIGIIVLGLGLATMGRSLNRPEWVVLGLGGALFHVISHSLFKPLMFMGAGGILHATGTRQMDKLGGLGKRMPRSFVLFLIGAVAICGLPPLNGFVGELLLYVGLFGSVTAKSPLIGWVGLAAPALALVGALAVASFVKATGTVFGGASRSEATAHAHDPEATMLAPMWVLAGCCLGIGVLPVILIKLLDLAVRDWAPSVDGSATPGIAAYVPLGWVTIMGMGCLAAIGLLGVWFLRSPARREARKAGTWDCGYARPTWRMEYSGSSLSQMLVNLLGWALWPRQKTPEISGVFATRATFESDLPDVVLDRSLLPAFGSAAWLLGWARVLQRGPIHVYLLYVLGILLLMLLLA